MTKYVVLAQNRWNEDTDWRVADTREWATRYATKFAETYDLVHVRECAATAIIEVAS